MRLLLVRRAPARREHDVLAPRVAGVLERGALLPPPKARQGALDPPRGIPRARTCVQKARVEGEVGQKWKRLEGEIKEKNRRGRLREKERDRAERERGKEKRERERERRRRGREGERQVMRHPPRPGPAQPARGWPESRAPAFSEGKGKAARGSRKREDSRERARGQRRLLASVSSWIVSSRMVTARDFIQRNCDCLAPRSRPSPAPSGSKQPHRSRAFNRLLIGPPVESNPTSYGLVGPNPTSLFFS